MPATSSQTGVQVEPEGALPRGMSKHSKRYQARVVACQVQGCSRDVPSKAYFKVSECRWTGGGGESGGLASRERAARALTPGVALLTPPPLAPPPPQRYAICLHHFNLASMVLNGAHVRWCQQCGKYVRGAGRGGASSLRRAPRAAPPPPAPRAAPPRASPAPAGPPTARKRPAPPAQVPRHVGV